jgi:hypothetical protein
MDVPTGTRSSLDLKRDKNLSVLENSKSPTGSGAQPYHVKDELKRLQKVREVEERQRIKEEALQRIRGMQQRASSKAYEDQEESETIDHPKVEEVPGSAQMSSVKGTRTTRKRPLNNITLEGLRNIADTKDLFSKADEEKFN